MTATGAGRVAGGQRWLKVLGAAGFWFFFVKGVLWLAAPLVFYWLT